MTPELVVLILFPLVEVVRNVQLYFKRNDLLIIKRSLFAICVTSLAGWLAYFNLVLSSSFGGGGVSCWLFYISSLLVAPLSVGPHVIRALRLRGAIEYYEVASKIRFTDSIVEVHEQTARRPSNRRGSKTSNDSALSLSTEQRVECALIMERSRIALQKTKVALVAVTVVVILVAIAFALSDAKQIQQQCHPEPKSIFYAFPILGIVSAILAFAVPFHLNKIDDELQIATEIRRNSIFLGFSNIAIVGLRFAGYDEWQSLMQTVQQMFLSLSMATILLFPHLTLRLWHRVSPATAIAVPGSGYGRPLPRTRESNTRSSLQNIIGRRASSSEEMISREAVVSWDAGLCVLLSSEDGIASFIKHCTREFSSENIQFWCAINEYKAKYDEATRRSLDHRRDPLTMNADINVDMCSIAGELYKMFIDNDSPTQVNLSSKQKLDIKYEIDACCGRKGSGSLRRDLFDAAQKEIFAVMSRDSYPRYLSSKCRISKQSLQV